MTMRLSVVTTGLFYAALALCGAVTAQQQSAVAPGPDLSGIWNRLDNAGGGSYAGIDRLFPRAQLRPEAAAKLPPPVDQGLDASSPQPLFVRAANGALLPPAAAAAGGPSATAGRCNIGGGFGGLDINSAGMAIMQSSDEVIIARDGGAGGRRLYLNREMPPLSRIAPTAIGYSIARWEGRALVVTTTGFAPGLVAFGRGWRERATVLTESLKLTPDGKRLSITYTWTDPKVYVKPHTYTIQFERVDNGYVFETWCDASSEHPENYTTIAPPPQSSSDADNK